MPWYNDLRPKQDDKKQSFGLIFPEMSVTDKKRCIKNILKLRIGISQNIVAKKSESNLLVASWNIKEFGHTSQRLPEAFFYIAEILNAFDLIAIQEIKSSLKDLKIIMRLLGKDWKYLVNDITEGADGNSERSAYLYNSKRVELAGVAGEITIPKEISAGSAIKQLKRTPFITGFKSGWKKFSLINLHLHPGDNTSARDNDVEYRKEEVSLFLETIKTKFDKNRFWNENVIVVGDFNFYQGKDEDTIDLFLKEEFSQIDKLIESDTNASKTEIYDRMFFKVNDYFKIQNDSNGQKVGGVFNPFDYVYKLEKWNSYKSKMENVYDGDMPLGTYFERYWRKNQISDHFPIWAEIITDSSDDFLRGKLKDFKPKV